ncbi:MAG: ribosome maturation factor RimP [bacterium]
MSKISSREQQIFDELKPIVDPLGVKLLDVEYKTHNRRPLLRVVIASEQGVSLDQCEEISEQILPVIDLLDVDLRGEYDLEVTSPGVERTLRRDFEVDFFAGRQVAINCYGSYEGKKIWTGCLIATAGENIIIDSDGEKVEIPKKLVASIKLKFDADAALKSGGSGDDG